MTEELKKARKELITYTENFLKKPIPKYMQYLSAGTTMRSVSDKLDFFSEPENLKSLTHINIDELRELMVLMEKFLRLETDIAVVNIILENTGEPEPDN